MGFFKKDNQENIQENQDISINQQNPPNFFETKLDKEIVELVSGKGNPDRLSHLTKQERLFVMKIITKNAVIFKNSKLINNIVDRYMNLAVSQDGRCINIIKEMATVNVLNQERE